MAKSKADKAKDEKPVLKLTAQVIRKRFDDARMDIRSDLDNYWLNYAFWGGDQWLQRRSRTDGITPVATEPGQDHRERAVINKIEPAIHNTVSRVMKVPTVFEVLAQAADDHSHQGALKGESIIRMKHLNENWEVTKEKGITAALLGGTAGLATFWDPSANQYTDDIATGDACIEALTLEEFVLECGTKDASKARWWIYKQVLHPESVQAMFEMEETPAADGDSGGPFSSTAIKQSSSLVSRPGTEVITYFERPNFLNKAGTVAVVVGNEIVSQSAWPFPFKNRLNIDVITCIFDPEKWTGNTPVTQARSPQRQINQLATKFHESIHRILGTKLTVDERQLDAFKKATDDPEEILPLKGIPDAIPPKYLDHPQLPSYVVQQYTTLSNEIDNILGVHAISRGDTPANAPDSGYGLSLLAENDATPAGRLAKEQARAWANQATNVLELYADKVKDTRPLVVQDKRRMAHRVDWVGKDLAGQTRVIVPADSTLPRSHAGMMKMGERLMEMRPDWFPTPGAWLSFIQMPGMEHMTQILDSNTALAEIENYKLAQGHPITVNEFDDDAKHIQQHNEFCMSPEYFSLPEETQQLIRLHVQNHKQAARSKAGEQRAEEQLQEQLLNPAMNPTGPAIGPNDALQPGTESLVPEIPVGE